MSIRVVARIRPLLNTEIDRDTVVTCDNAVVKIPNPKNAGEEYSFAFNSVYDAKSTQQDLFDGEIAPTIKHLFNGFDITLFAYGVTGTGKTHTMRGGKSLADRGVIPRLLSGIYRRGRKIEKDSQGDTKVEVAMSYYEIYNDRVFDLFEHPEKRTATGLTLRDNGGKTVVVGLTERPCESLKDFEKLYDQANVNRSTSATKLNAHSSRSHAILCVKIIVSKGDTMRISTASAIDLAGSEDNRRTDNNKERLVESSAINKSLFVLAQCVEAISKKQARIPYRESKMTRILSLGQNNGLTIMILNLAPVRAYHLDTLASLNFANRTKKIEIREAENEPAFKGPPRPAGTILGSSVQRQALRQLTTASHNTNVRAAVPSADEQLAKPAKAFSVFSDKLKPVSTTRTAYMKPLPSLKRTPDHFSTASQAEKQPAISQSAIEDMVERKVTEILAARALDQPVAPAKNINDDVRKRLDYLEQKIDGQDDARAKGLSYLLMAKQHQAHGEDASALKMYELAREYFPDNQKLETKIERIKARILEKKEPHQADSQFASIAPVHRSLTAIRPPADPRKAMKQVDDIYTPSDNEEDDELDASYHTNKPRKQRRLNAKPIYLDDEDLVSQTPRTKHLLSIINSRDVDQIRCLKGVGSRKAEAIIESLCEEEIQFPTTSIRSLGQLSQLRGVGQKTVENWRTGLHAETARTG